MKTKEEHIIELRTEFEVARQHRVITCIKKDSAIWAWQDACKEYNRLKEEYIDALLRKEK